MAALENSPQPNHASTSELSPEVRKLLQSMRRTYSFVGPNASVLFDHTISTDIELKAKLLDRLYEVLSKSFVSPEKSNKVLKGRIIKFVPGEIVSQESENNISIGSEAAADEVSAFVGGLKPVEEIGTSRGVVEEEKVEELKKEVEEKVEKQEDAPAEEKVVQTEPAEVDVEGDEEKIGDLSLGKKVEPDENLLKPFEKKEEVVPVEEIEMPEAVDISDAQPRKEEAQEENKEQEVKEEKQETGEQVPEWQRSEEWKKFVELRENTARAEVNKNILLAAAVEGDEYLALKDSLARNIKESLIKEAGENLTPERQKELDAKIVDTIYEELLLKEREAYIDEVRRIRGETLKGAAKETLRMVTGLKFIDKYLKLNKWARYGINTAVVAGVMVGGAFIGGGSAVGAMGYGVYRGVRGAASLAGVGVGLKGAEKLGLDIKKVDEWEKEELDKIKNSEASLDQRSRELDKIKTEAEKKRRKIIAGKTAVAVGLGAGAGVAVGGILDSVYGSHGAGVSSALDRNRTSVRSGFEPTIKPKVMPEVEETQTVKMPASREGAVEDFSKAELPKVKIANESLASEIFNDPEKLSGIGVVKGDSLWRILSRTFEQNKDFSGMNEAQKQNVIAFFSNKIINSPENYGFEPDPNFGVKLEVGKAIDLTKLFDDESEIENFKTAVAKAHNLTDAQQEKILEQGSKIGNYLEKHSGEPITLDKTDEILATEAGGKTVEAPEEIPDKKPQPEAYEFHRETKTSEPVTETAAALVDKKVLPINMGRSMMNDLVTEQKFNAAYRDELDDLFGKKGLFRRVNGVDSKEWAFIKGKPANEMMKYYTGDSANSILDDETKQVLTNSAKYQNFLKYLTGLQEDAKGSIAPGEKETVEAFFRRLGFHIFKNSLTGNKSVAA